jgi:hypothetical protein
LVESVKAPLEPRTFTELSEKMLNNYRFGSNPVVHVRVVKFNSAFSFPQRCEVGAGGYGRLHVLHRNPFERTMRVVLTAKQIWGREGRAQSGVSHRSRHG